MDPQDDYHPVGYVEFRRRRRKRADGLDRENPQVTAFSILLRRNDFFQYEVIEEKKREYFQTDLIKFKVKQ